MQLIKAGGIMHSIKHNLERFKIVRLALYIYRIRAIRALFPVAIIALVYWEGQQELKGIDLRRTLHELRHVSSSAIVQMLVTSFFAVAVMSAYDYLIRVHFQLRVGLWSIFRYAWIANTFNNILGFAGLAGVGLRSLLYKKSGVPISVLTPAIIFLSPLMITGLSLLSWAIIFGILPAGGLLQKHHWLQFAIWGMALYLPIFVFVQRSSLFAKWINRGQGRTPWLTVSASVGSSFLEWFFAGLAFWTIGNHILGGIHFVTIFSIYAVAAIAGILSMAPGGIGAFDLIALLGLTQLGYESDEAMAVLVIFRLFYYVIPWLIGLVLAALEIGIQGKKILERTEPGFEPPLNMWQKVWRWPGQLPFLSDLGVWALGKLVLASGLILLLSAATPELIYRLKITEQLLTVPIMKISHHLSVVIGFMLILLSRGIAVRIQRAYMWTSLFLFLGAVFAITKGFDYEEAIFLLVVGLILWISRGRFYRVSVPFTRQSTVGWVILTSSIAFGYFILGSYAHRGFMKHLPPGVQPEWLQQHSRVAFTAVGGLLFSWLLLTLMISLRPERRMDSLPSSTDLTRLEHFLTKTSGNTLTHMLFLGDKSLYWSMNGQVLFPFARVRDKLVVLGDPLGPKSLMKEGISEFRQEADKYGLTVVFYQTTPDFYPIYEEQGYLYFKLGEEGFIPLDSFTLNGTKNVELRSISRRFEQEGYTFEIAEAPHSELLLRELRLISKEWLAGRTEKGFSMGWFKESYLQTVPIGLLRSPDTRIVAYASMVPGYDDQRTISIDLMRHRQHLLGGTMDYLYVCLLNWSKDQGYERFNLGNTPLSSVSQNVETAREEKLAHLVFKRGSHGHGYQGLRQYKEKFSPEWESRYIAYPATLSLPILMLDLVRLASRHPSDGE